MNKRLYSISILTNRSSNVGYIEVKWNDTCATGRGVGVLAGRRVGKGVGLNRILGNKGGLPAGF